MIRFLARLIDRLTSRDLLADVESLRSDLMRMPLDEQIRRANDVLADPSRFRCEERGSATGHEFRALGPITQQFFQRFAAIHDVRSGFSLRFPTGLPSAINAIIVGDDLGGELLFGVFPGTDNVWVLDGAGGGATEKDMYPNIYHLILEHDRTVDVPIS